MIDLEAIISIAEGYEARKKALIERKVRQDQAYLATFAEGDSVKAFEALRPLVERVRELEEQLGRAQEKVKQLEKQRALEREWMLTFAVNTCTCRRCRFFAVCGPQYDCRKTLSRKLTGYVKRIIS